MLHNRKHAGLVHSGSKKLWHKIWYFSFKLTIRFPNGSGISDVNPSWYNLYHSWLDLCIDHIHQPPFRQRDIWHSYVLTQKSSTYKDFFELWKGHYSEWFGNKCKKAEMCKFEICLPTIILFLKSNLHSLSLLFKDICLKSNLHSLSLLSQKKFSSKICIVYLCFSKILLLKNNLTKTN